MWAYPKSNGKIKGPAWNEFFVEAGVGGWFS